MRTEDAYEMARFLARQEGVLTGVSGAGKSTLINQILYPALARALREAVEIRLVAEVPLGAFLSGGVDSTVCAVLLDRAIGKQLHGVFVNNGVLRKNEFEDVTAMRRPPES